MSQAARVGGLDWQRMADDLDGQGNAMIPGLLAAEECRRIAGLYPQDDLFRSRVVMGPR